VQKEKFIISQLYSCTPTIGAFKQQTLNGRRILTACGH